MHPKTTEKGQALVLIALAAVGLFAFAALAIDGSRVFSDRRHSQNASDTAAYAAALARVRGSSTWADIGKTRASSNGYTSNGVTLVEVYTCKEWKDLSGEECKGLPATLTDTIRNEYVIVRIKSIVDLTLARVIGWKQITNYTDAVVRASPAKIDEWFDGMALVAANTTCPGPGDFGPFETGGSSNTVVTNSGVFVNAACPTSFVDNGGGTLTTAQGICLVDTYDNNPPVTGITPLPSPDCGDQVDITQYWMPDSDPSLDSYCSSTAGTITGSGGNYVATPGRFGGGAFPAKSPSGTLRLTKGIYCLDSGISLNAGWEITTDNNDNGVFDPATEGVFFYLRDNNIKFNGGMNLDLYAMTDTTGGFSPSFLHYLIYVPAAYKADIVLTGDGDSNFTGMVLAPNSNVDIKGSTTGLDLHTQIIALNTRLTGNGTINITYDPNEVPPAMIMPAISGIE